MSYTHRKGNDGNDYVFDDDTDGEYDAWKDGVVDDRYGRSYQDYRDERDNY